MSERICLVYGVPYTVEPAFETVTKYDENTGRPYQEKVDAGRDVRIGTKVFRVPADEDFEYLRGYEVHPTYDHSDESFGGIIGIANPNDVDIAELPAGSVAIAELALASRADVDAFKSTFSDCEVTPEWYIRYY
jgi:hypothetical protein